MSPAVKALASDEPVFRSPALCSMTFGGLLNLYKQALVIPFQKWR